MNTSVLHTGEIVLLDVSNVSDGSKEELDGMSHPEELGDRNLE